MRLVNFDEGAWVALLFDMTVQKKKFWERQAVVSSILVFIIILLIATN